MKKKYFWIIGLISIVFIPAGLMANYFYYEKIHLRDVKEGMIRDLSLKYRKGFIVRDMIYGKALGDDEGTYTDEVCPAGNKEIKFQVILSEEGKILSEDYKEMKWRSEAIESWKPVMDKFGIASYAVNIEIPDEIEEQYNLDETYTDIYQKHKNVMREILFIGEVEKSFDKKMETARVIEVTNYALQRGLHDFLIEWRYYEKGNKNAGVFELRKNVPSYSYSISKKDVANRVTVGNIDRQFLQHN